MCAYILWNLQNIILKIMKKKRLFMLIDMKDQPLWIFMLRFTHWDVASWLSGGWVVWLCSRFSSPHDRNQRLSNCFHLTCVSEPRERLDLGPVMFYKYVALATKHVIKHRVTPADQLNAYKIEHIRKCVIVPWNLPRSFCCWVMWLLSL